MSLNQEQLKIDIKDLINDMMGKEENSIDEFASRLSDAIVNCIKTGTVTVASGIPVNTTGTAVAQVGATSGTGTGTIS